MIQFDAQRSHIIPFGEYLRVKENGLEMVAINTLAASFRENHPRKNILFDSLSDDNHLVFTVLNMPVDTWQVTEQKHKISYSEYLQVCQGTTDSYTKDNEELKSEQSPNEYIEKNTWLEKIKSLFRRY